MNKWLPAITFSVLLLAAVGAQNAFAAQVQITPQKDTFILNGAGPFGLAPIMSISNNGITEERTLVSFDLSSIPSGSIVTSVQVDVESLGANGAVVTLHKITTDWNEFAATWTDTGILLIPWGSPGGDFVNTASASQTITGSGMHTFGSSVGMVQDVQSWIDLSSTNFGWLLKTTSVPNAAVFATKEHANTNFVPLLTVTFTPPGENNGGQQAVAGKIIPIETTSLLVSGIQTNLSWIITAAAIVAGASAFLVRRK